jgi:membrane protein implicated in regulation of membrane protease activity
VRGLTPLPAQALWLIVIAFSMAVVTRSMSRNDQIPSWLAMVLLFVALAIALYVLRRWGRPLLRQDPLPGDDSKSRTGSDHTPSARDRWIAWLHSKPSWIGKSLAGLVVGGPIALLALVAFDNWALAALLFAANFVLVAATARKP